MSITPFLLDGETYNVHVMNLTRKFSVLDTSQSGRTQGGSMYRDVIGTFYNYTMTVAEKDGDHKALDAFWEAVSQPNVSHSCEFLYGQSTLSQEMYVTSGEQSILLKTAAFARWGEITLNFIAMEPKVVPV